MGRRKNTLRVIEKYGMTPIDRAARAGVNYEIRSDRQRKMPTITRSDINTDSSQPYSEDARLKKATPITRQLYHLFKQAILGIGDDISFKPTKKHIGVWAGASRIANFTINIQSFKIWLNVPPGTLRNDSGKTNVTKIAHTINVSGEDQLPLVLDWIRQAYARR